MPAYRLEVDVSFPLKRPLLSHAYVLAERAPEGGIFRLPPKQESVRKIKKGKNQQSESDKGICSHSTT